MIDPELAYSTNLGGSGGIDLNFGSVAVDTSGDAYVAGITGPDFPTSPGAFQTTFGGGSFDAFVTKLNATGSALVYSTYLGGSGDEFDAGIAVDGSQNAYITGETMSPNFPTTSGVASRRGPLSPS